MNYLIEVASATESFRTTVWAASELDAQMEADLLCRLLEDRPGGTWRVNGVRALA